MSANIAQLVQEWDDALLETTAGEKFDHLHQRLIFAARQLYWQFLPTISSEQLGFEERLARWIGAVSADPRAQRILLELAGRIIWNGREDFDKLHQAALSGPITRWIIDLLGLSFSAGTFAETIADAIHDDTWYLGLSDSMAIADFHHINRIGGVDYRPDVRSLSRFSDAATMIAFMQHPRSFGPNRPLKRLVVLEDFIGSGTQLQDAQALILDLCRQGVPIILVPLLICPSGDQAARDLAAAAGPNLRYAPVLHIDTTEFVCPAVIPGEGAFHAAVRSVAHSTYPLVEGDNAAHPRPYGPFGFQHTGSLVVMFGNTPANSLPVIQHQSNAWTPLFPRSARVR